MAEKSKDPKDPFGGLLFRSREQVLPVEKKEDVATSFAQKREEMKKATLSKADEAIVENETAKIRNDTARLDAEYLELRARLAQGQVPIGGNTVDSTQRFTGTTKALNDILQLGQQTGIDVMPLIRQVLTGQPLTPPAAAQSMDGIPNPIIAAFGKILEKSFDNNTKPHEDAKMLVLEERLKNQEQLINKELSDLKNLLIQQRGEVKDPAQTMTDSVKSLTALMAALKGLTPEPAPAAIGRNAELDYKYQDRQWSHEEAKLNAEIERQKIVANMEVEQKKLEQSRNNLAEIPQMIGAVVAQSLMEGGKDKGTGAAPAPRKQKIDTLKIFKSKGLPHGAINYKCPECQADIAFVTSAKSVNCISCGSIFKILLEETEAPTVNQTAPREEPAAVASTSDDDYLFRRGR